MGRRLQRSGRAVRLTFLVVALLPTVGAAAGGRGNVDGTLVLGSLAPETGDLSIVAQSLRVPVQLAVEEINAAGGVNGAAVTLVTGDDGSDPSVAGPTVDRMLRQDLVDAIIGPARSTTTQGILDRIEREHAVVCSGSNTSPELSRRGIANGYYFRTAPPDRLQPRATAQLILPGGHQRVAVIAMDDAYGRRFARALGRALVAGGTKVVGSLTYEPGGADYEDLTRDVAAARPDALALIAFPGTGSQVLRALIAAELGPGSIPTYVTDGLNDSSLPGLVDASNPGAIAGLTGTAPAAAPAGITHPFLDTLALTGLDAVFSAYYYDCTMIIALAAAAAESDDPAKVRRHIRRVLNGDKRCSTFAECKSALERGATINFDGAASSYDGFADHEPTSGVYDVFTFDDRGERATLGGDAQIAVG